MQYPAQYPIQQPYPQMGYGQTQPYQPMGYGQTPSIPTYQQMPQPMPQPMMAPAAPRPRPYAQPPVTIAPMARPVRGKQPKVSMPADYDPRHPPIGFMPDLPQGLQEDFNSGVVMHDDSSRGQRKERQLGSWDEEGMQPRTRARAAREDAQVTRASKIRRRSKAHAAQAEAQQTAQADKLEQDQLQAEAAQTDAKTRDAAAVTSEHTTSDTSSAKEAKMPFRLEELPAPAECVLLTGEAASSSRAGNHIIQFIEPLVQRGDCIVYDEESRTFELRRDGVYHFAYSGRVTSETGKKNRRSLSGLGVVQGTDEVVHAMPADHTGKTPCRASFIGEYKKGDRVRLQWHIEAADTALSLTEPLLLIERLK
ncbi:hypothetical protein FACS1894184_10840 [Clostridia bacterium]|nr:hypothetical protein FACS1894184_10840 [Clostridia bacterium]